MAILADLEAPSPALFVCIALGLVVSAVYTLWIKAWPKPLPGIPYDVEASKSLSGDLSTLKTDPDGLASWAAKHLTRLQTPVSQAMLGPFSKPVVLVADIGDTREHMMRSEFDRSSYIIDRFVLFGGSQIRAPTNDQWKTSRGWLKDLLSPTYMQKVVAPSIHTSMLELIQLWETSAKVAGPNRPFSILQDMKDLALDVMTRFHHNDEFSDLAIPRQTKHVSQFGSKLPASCIGKDNGVTFSHAPQNLFGQSVMEIGDRMAAIYTMASPPGLVSWLTKNVMPKYRTWFAERQKVLKSRFSTAVQRMSEGEPANNAIDYMVLQEDKAARKEGRRPMFKDQIMIDEAFGNHIAGLHTTSSAMVWIMKYLTEHQDVQAKVVEELKAAFPEALAESRVPTAEELIATDLPYTRAVIEETLRLRAAFIIARDAIVDTDLLGYRIPAGTVCLLICQGVEELASMRSKGGPPERKYPGVSTAKLEDFDPERWLARDGGKVRFDGSSNAQMAFGLGRRACWGRKVAELEMRMMTAMVTWNLELLPVAKSLSSHDAFYDFSYRATQGFVQLRKREL